MSRKERMNLGQENLRSITGALLEKSGLSGSAHCVRDMWAMDLLL